MHNNLRVMQVTVNTNIKDFFRKRLELLRPFSPYNSLQKRELDTLALLQYYYYTNRDVEISKRHKLIFDYETMLNIREELGLSEASLNNSKLMLRTKGLIDKKSIKPFLIVDPLDVKNTTLTFNLKINDL